MTLGYRRDASVDARELQALNEVAEVAKRLFMWQSNPKERMTQAVHLSEALARLDAVRGETGGTE